MRESRSIASRLHSDACANVSAKDSEYYSVVVRTIGKSFGIGFGEDMAAREKIAIGDKVDLLVFQIVKEGVPTDTNIMLHDCEVIKSGGKAGGVTIDKKLADGQGITRGTVLNVKINKRRKP